MELPTVELLKLAQQQLLDYQVEETIFIPLSGCRDPGYAGNVVLEDEVAKYLAEPSQQCMLLAGHSGSGKSLYTQNLARRLWQGWKEDSPIPLWISLPSCNNPLERVIEETLEKCGLNNVQIEQLRESSSFIFILDGYDEIRCLQNLINSNRLVMWKAKAIITCRHEYLYSLGDFRRYFAPYIGQKENFMALSVLYVKPFEPEQIESYVKQYLDQNADTPWRDWEQYQNAIQSIPGVKELIQTPFLLKLAVEALPDIFIHFQSHMDQVNQKEIKKAKLYDVFFQQWFLREEKKLKLSKFISEDENLIPEFWNYAKSLARLMREHNLVQIEYNEGDYSLFDDGENQNPFAVFLDPHHPRNPIYKRACMLREVQVNNFAFVHLSLLDYFFSLSIQGPGDVPLLGEGVNKTYQPKSEFERLRDELNNQLLDDSTETLRYITDRLVENIPGYKQNLRQIVFSSKENPNIAKAAANAITALVRFGEPFNGADLSGVQLQGADLSGGYFDGANFSDADLSNARLFRIWMRNANVDRCVMTDVKFGETNLIHHEEFLGIFDFHEDSQHIVMVCKTEIIIYDLFSDNVFQSLKSNKIESYSDLPDNSFERDDFIKFVKIQPKGNIVVVGCDDHAVRIWDYKNSTKLSKPFGPRLRNICVAFSTDSELLAIGGSDIYYPYADNVQIWEVEKETPVDFLEHSSKINDLSFSYDSRYLATACDDGNAIIWDRQNKNNKEPTMVFKHRRSPGVGCVRFSPDGNQLITANTYGTCLFIWDVMNGDQIRTIKASKASHVRSVNFSSDGYILAGCSNDVVYVWEYISGKEIYTFLGHKGNVLTIKFSRDNKNIVSGGEDNTVRVWDIENSIQQALRSTLQGTYAVEISPDGKWLAAIDKKFIKIWNLTNRDEEIQLNTAGTIICTKFSADSQYFVSADTDYIRIWVVETWLAIRILKVKNEINVLRIKYNKEWEVLTSIKFNETFDKSMNWIDMFNEEVIVLHKDSMIFSNDNKFVAHSTIGNKILIWDFSLRQYVYSHSDVSCMSFSSSRNLMVLGNRDGSIQIKDLIKSACSNKIKSHKKAVNVVKFICDDKLVISGSSDRTVRILDISEFQVISVLKFQHKIRDLSFHTNGYIGIVFENGILQIWKNIGDNNEFRWSLILSSSSFNESLNLEGLQASTAINLSEKNRRFLNQHGAIATKWVRTGLQPKVAKMTGSPIYRNNDAATSEESGQLMNDDSRVSVVQKSSWKKVTPKISDADLEDNDTEKNKDTKHCSLM